MNAQQLLDGKRICICVGAGGVGKTTTAAAIAVGMAAQGLKVAVVTMKKSIEASVPTWLVRNVRHVCEGVLQPSGAGPHSHRKGSPSQPNI